MIDHRLLAAPLTTIDVRWLLRSDRRILVGPTPRLVLHLEALRDVEICLSRVNLFDLLPDTDWNWCLVQAPALHGVRRLHPEGERWVVGRQDLAQQPGSEVLPVGDFVRAPHDFSANPSRLDVPKGACIGVLVQATAPAWCEARLGGE